MPYSQDARRILIVDDSPDIHEDYRKILCPGHDAGDLDELESAIFGDGRHHAPIERYELDSAYQGAEAVEMVRSAAERGHPYALAFVDMRMPPGWDGLETIERLWAIDDRIQIVICTAYSDHSREEIVARTGGAHNLVILKKPFDTAEVAQLAYAMTVKWLASRRAEIKMTELENLVQQRTGEIAEANDKLEEHVHELERTRDALLKSEQRFALAAEGAHDGLWDWDLPADRVFYSARWNAIVGLPEQAHDGAPDHWLSRVHPNDAPAVRRSIDEHCAGDTPYLETEHRVRAHDGEYVWVLCRGLAIRDDAGAPVRMAGSMSDISRRKETEQELRRGAYFDKLTGLPNRALFRECLEEAIAESHARGSRFTVLFLDFDNFKVVNDSLGHLAGDDLLVEVGARITRCLKQIHPEHTLARLGGDEFVVLLRGAHDKQTAIEIVRAINATLSEPLQIQGVEVHTSASIGVTIDDGRYGNPDEILRDADTAMYNAKTSGVGQFSVFDAEMREGALARLELENQLRWAIQRGDIAVHYQPIVDLETGTPMGVEALARWTHPDLGPVSPDRFIPIAEETGLIVPLGELVLQRACRDIKRIRDLGPDTGHFRVNVNLSSRQFAQPSLVALVTETLREHDLPPDAICLEVTETVVMEDVDAAAATIRRLRALGIEVYMDDFGTGYSSLSCLKLLPLSGLKLDRSFIAHIEEGAANPAIIHAVVTLAGHLRLNVVAEGIETTDQLAAVLALECDRAQGYHFGRPMPIEDVQAWLTEPPQRREAA